MATRKKLLNLYECAEQMQLPVKWLKKAAIDGKIPCLRLGKRDMRFNPEAVNKALSGLAGLQLRKTILSGGRSD